MHSILRMTAMVAVTAAAALHAADDWVAPADAAAVVNPLAANAAAAVKGQRLYTQNCQICHGTSGAGDGAGAAALDPKPASLVDPKVTSQSDGALFWKISNGRGSMLAWNLVLKDDAQRWQLVNYIRTLAPAPSK